MAPIESESRVHRAEAPLLSARAADGEATGTPCEAALTTTGAMIVGWMGATVDAGGAELDVAAAPTCASQAASTPASHVWTCQFCAHEAIWV